MVRTGKISRIHALSITNVTVFNKDTNACVTYEVSLTRKLLKERKREREREREKTCQENGRKIPSFATSL